VLAGKVREWRAVTLVVSGLVEKVFGEERETRELVVSNPVVAELALQEQLAH
jgi:peroxiredoxin